MNGGRRYYCGEYAASCKDPVSELTEYRKRAKELLEGVLKQNTNGSYPYPLSPVQVLDIKACMATLCEEASELPRAESLYREVDRGLREILPSAVSPSRLDATAKLAQFLSRQGKFAQSAEYFRELLQALRGSTDYIAVSTYHMELASALFHLDQPAQATAQAQRAEDCINRLTEASQRCNLFCQLAPVADMIGPPSLAARCWLNARGPEPNSIANCRLGILAAAALVKDGKYDEAAKLSCEACKSIRDAPYLDRVIKLQELNLLLARAYPKERSSMQVANMLALVKILATDAELCIYLTCSMCAYREAHVKAPVELVDKASDFLKAALSNEDILADGAYYSLLREFRAVRRAEGIGIIQEAIARLHQNGRVADLHRAAGAETLLAAWYVNLDTTMNPDGADEGEKALALVRIASVNLLRPPLETASTVVRDEQLAWLIQAGNIAAICRDYSLAEKLHTAACAFSEGAAKLGAEVGLASTYVLWGKVSPAKYESGRKLLLAMLESKQPAPNKHLETEIYRLLGCVYGGQRRKRECLESFDRSLKINADIYPPEPQIRRETLLQKLYCVEHFPHTEAELRAAVRALRDAYL